MLRRSVAGVLAAGALLTGTAGVIGAAIVLTAGPASAGPAEDCAAVRARDHQIYLNLIASLPPGSPIPPEYINPCLTAPSTTTTAPPTSTAGLPGAQAPGGGPNVGANAPTNFPTYNGTPIVPAPGPVPVPGVVQTATPGAPAAPGGESPAGVPAATATSSGAPTSPQPAGSTAPTAVPDRGPGPIPTDTDSNTAPAQPVPDAGSPTAGVGQGDGRDRYLELVLVGAAAFTAGGIGVRGRRSPFGPRTPESILSQAVGTVASPLMQYDKGGQSKITVPDPGGGRRTLFLIHDRSSSHESVIPVDVPPGGRMSVDPDGSVTVVDADGNPVSTVAAPWAYDADGTPIPTHFEIRDGYLVQVVDTVGIENILYPILADPPKKESKKGSKQVGKAQNTAPRKPNSMTSRTPPQSQAVTADQRAANQLAAAHGEVPEGFTGDVPIEPGTTGTAPNSMTSRTPPQSQAVTADQRAANQLAAAHGEVPEGFTGDVPLPVPQAEPGRQHPTTTGQESNFYAAEEFIYDEMTVNSQSRTVKTIHQLLEPPRWYEFGRNPGGDVNAAMVMWFAKVAPNQDWDHKPQIEERLGLQNADDYFCKQPDSDREVFYDIYSNMHYGYVGRAAGFDAETLISGASLGESLLVGKDDYGDQITMRKGIQLYDQYGEGLTQQQLHQGIVEAMDEMQAAQSQGSDVPQIRPTR
jgi:hypothetical protein